MLTNQLFLGSILNSFKSFIQIGTSRSTAKLKPLHGAIAEDLAQRLGDAYIIKSQGYGDDSEAVIRRLILLLLKRSQPNPLRVWP